MDKNDVLKLYDEDYAQEYNRKFIFSDCHADFEQETITNLLSEIGEGAKWLDVACGTGYFLSCFPNIERAGLDISPAMLKVAKQENPGVLLIEGDFRVKHPQWQGEWDLVSCMWWAYCYVESLSEIEKVVENLASWTSERGVCFLPIGNPEVVAVGEIDLPYVIENIAMYGGRIKLEGVIWSWIDEESGKQHLNLLAPQLEHMVSLLGKYFDSIEIIEYPSYKKRKAIVARSKKLKQISEAQRVDSIKVEGLFSLFSNTVRADNWWLYKIPPLLAIAYAEILLLGLSFIQSIAIILSLLFISICAASYGHIINNIFDIEVDRQVGKSNSMARFPLWQSVLFCVLFVIAGFVLPILMNFGTWAIILLGINYLLPTLYSAPPLRLKEKGIWGVVSDAAGAHAIPTLFFAATFLHLSTTPQPESIILTITATVWSFCAGIRGIFLHQLWDRENDLKSDVKTLVTSLDVEKVRFWISYIIFPIEISLLILLVLVISRFAPILLVFFILYVLLKTINIKLVLANAFEPAPTRKANVALHDFYEVWLPLALITLLSIREPLFLILLLLHIILFYPSIKQRTTDLVQLMVSGLKGLTNLVKFTNEYEQKVDFLPTNQQNKQGLEKLQAQLHTSQTEFTKLNSHLQQTQEQLEQIQAKFQQTQGELQQSQSQLHTSQTELLQSQSDLQQTQEQSEQIQAQLRQTEKELAQSQSQLHISQTELVQLKSYLQQTQGVEGIINYYRSRIVSNPDDIQLYHQALTIKPDDVQIHLQLGNALVRQNRFCDAIAIYQTALQFHPDNFEIHLELAKALEKEQKWEDAIATYRRAIELNPDYSWSHKHLGDILAERGQLNDASTSYRHALQLQPRIF
ncbi:tetratricopeptide repeat protein [Calothrix sp. PCC 7507]|uniref:tetratricopeptide repeat protein n=1 Tax=Calothrix sp. PCC 7507 TaxID=99598 RepID=UPI00029F476C|nr:tetratricopeptide repeat protein [Calothrix sp. PCC 7507]AFY35384.1 Methyltransferase type 11 [Calothrix sp. PCC 7507]